MTPSHSENAPDLESLRLAQNRIDMPVTFPAFDGGAKGVCVCTTEFFVEAYVEAIKICLTRRGESIVNPWARKITRDSVERLLVDTVAIKKALGEPTAENMHEIVRLNVLRDACRIFIRSRSQRRDRARSNDKPSSTQLDLIIAALASKAVSL